MMLESRLSGLLTLLILAVLPHLLSAQTTVTLSTSPNPSKFGSPVILSATVTPSTATGRVTFYDGVTVLGTKPLVSGAASLSTISLPAGSRKLRAYYAGATPPATSNVVTQIVNAQPSASFAVRPPLPNAATMVLAVGDFNGDGKADIATFDEIAGTVGILLGDGAGNFQLASSTFVIKSFIADAAATGDFNGDGNLDLAYPAGVNVSVLLGKGDGTFQTPVSYPVGDSTSALAVGDFNGDGKPDIVTANRASGVKILLGNGDGTFQPAVTYSTSLETGPGIQQATFVVVGDFNGDGKPDLATSSGSAAVALLLGNGDGSFQLPTTIPIPNPTFKLISGDFNGDGKTDLVTDDASVLLGKGDGTFQPPVTYGPGPRPMISGDFNGDGNTDLFFTAEFTATILFGKGDGTFQPPVNYALGTPPTTFAVGDFNGDGRTDLAAGNSNTTQVNLLLGTTVTVTPAAGTPQSTMFGTAFPSPLQVVVKDGATPVSGVVVTFTAPSTVPVQQPSALLSSGTAVTDVNGMASVMATANSAPGSYSVTATALGVSALFSLTNLGGPPSVILPSPSTPQQTPAGTAFPLPLQVTLRDSFGLGASGVPVTFTAPTSGASAVFSSATVSTDASGVAKVTATANNNRGSYTVTATAAGLTATFSLTNLQPATVTLSSSAHPATFGAPLTLVATVTNATSTGRVTFFDGVNILGTKPVTSGIASISTILLPAGSRKLTAYYRDDVNVVTGTSNVLTQIVKATAVAAFFTQTPIALPAAAKSAVVADFNGDGKADFASPAQDTGSWWQVDLGASATVGSIVVWNRTDCCGDRLSDYWVFISNTPFLATDTPATLQNRAGTFSSHQTTAPNPSSAIPVNGAPGRYVRVQLSSANYLSLAEVQVFGTGAQTATNLALGKAATQSSTFSGYATAGAASAVDGNTDGNFFDGSVTSTSLYFVNVVLGKGDGTFQTPVNYAAEGMIASMAAGDFNGDGIADLALTIATPIPGNFGSIVGFTATLSVLEGNGDGTFRLAVDSPAGRVTSLGSVSFGPMAVGDFNSDGKADIVIGSSVAQSGHTSGSTALLTGNGDGTFSAPVSYPAPSPFVMADFNGDGKPDLAGLLNNPGGSFVVNLSVTLGNGDGTGTTLTANPGVSGPLLAGDFNGDVKTDLAGSGSILLGNGDGSFQAPLTYPGTAVATGDFNGDGIIDLVVADISGNLSGILLGNGDGTFRQGPAVQAGAPLAVADFNGDGRADLLTASANGAIVLLGATTGAIGVTASGGTPQSASVGTVFASPLQVTVLNNGVPVSGATVTFTAPTMGPTAVLSSSTATTNASGVASVTATANSVAGSYTVTASSQGVTVTFSLTNTTFAFLTATGGTPQSAELGAPFPSALQATVKDSVGNPVGGATVTFTAPAVGPSAILSSTTAVTNAAGVASVTATANSTPGTYLVTAGVGALSTTFSLTNLLGGGSNLALGRTATQSSTLPGYLTAGATSAVDGNTDGTFTDGSVTATNQDLNAWWQVDLGASAAISSVTVFNRTDCCGSRLGDFWVFISNTPFLATDTPGTLQNRTGTFASHQTSAPNPSATISVGANGRYVRVQLSSANYLSLAEVQVFGTAVPTISNLAQSKPATQSSAFPGYPTDSAAAAVDGNPDGNFADGSVTATNLDANAWWQVDLGASATVSSIVIWNRTDCCGSRLNDYWVFVSDTPFLPTDTPATLQFRAGTFSSHQTTAPNPSTTIPTVIHPCPPEAFCPDFLVQGRYVRVQLSSPNYLSLAEVQVYGTGGAPPPADLALGKTASQSSTFPGYATDGAAAAVDGNTDGNFGDGSVTATNLDPNPWWQVDLGASAAIGSIIVWNRTDCCSDRLNDFWVLVSDTPFLPTDTASTLHNRPGTFASHQTSAPNPSTTIAAGVSGRYVRVQLTNSNYLSLAEVQVFGQ